MITLVRFSEVRKGFRQGYAHCEPTTVCGMRAVEVSLRLCRRANRMYDRAAQMLRESGVALAVCRERAIGEELAARGIAAPQSRWITDIAASELAVCAMEKLKPERVGIYARRRTRELERTVAAVAARRRSIALALDVGGEEYADELMYDCGLSVALGRSAVARSELKVALSTPDFTLGSGAAVGAEVLPQAGLLTPKAVGYRLPGRFAPCGYPLEQLAAAAAKQGSLRPGEVGILDICFGNSIDNSVIHLYNTQWNPEKDER